MSIKQQIQMQLELLASNIIEDSDNYKELDDKDLLFATHIFSDVMLSFIYRLNKDKPLKSQEQIATECGDDLYKLILKKTGKDMKKLAHNYYV